MSNNPFLDPFLGSSRVTYPRIEVNTNGTITVVWHRASGWRYDPYGRDEQGRTTTLGPIQAQYLLDNLPAKMECAKKIKAQADQLAEAKEALAERARAC